MTSPHWDNINLALALALSRPLFLHCLLGKPLDQLTSSLIVDWKLLSAISVLLGPSTFHHSRIDTRSDLLSLRLASLWGHGVGFVFPSSYQRRE